MAKQKRERRFGLTSDKKSFVDAALVAQLTDGGFSRGKVIRLVTGGRGASCGWDVKPAFIFSRLPGVMPRGFSLS